MKTRTIKKRPQYSRWSGPYTSRTEALAFRDHYADRNPNRLFRVVKDGRVYNIESKVLG